MKVQQVLEVLQALQTVKTRKLWANLEAGLDGEVTSICVFEEGNTENSMLLLTARGTDPQVMWAFCWGVDSTGKNLDEEGDPARPVLRPLEETLRLFMPRCGLPVPEAFKS